MSEPFHVAVLNKASGETVIERFPTAYRAKQRTDETNAEKDELVAEYLGDSRDRKYLKTLPRVREVFAETMREIKSQARDAEMKDPGRIVKFTNLSELATAVQELVRYAEVAGQSPSVCKCDDPMELELNRHGLHVRAQQKPEPVFSEVSWKCARCGQMNSPGYQTCGRCGKSVTLV